MQLGQSIRQADSSHITEFQEASVSNSRICRYPKEAPPEGVGAIMDRQALGVAWLPTSGESTDGVAVALPISGIPDTLPS